MSFQGWYQFKLFIEHASGISMDALHVIVGFVIFFVSARLLKSSIASPLPWLALLLLELGNEAYDLKIELWPNLASQIGEAAKQADLDAFGARLLCTRRDNVAELMGEDR